MDGGTGSPSPSPELGESDVQWVLDEHDLKLYFDDCVVSVDGEPTAEPVRVLHEQYNAATRAVTLPAEVVLPLPAGELDIGDASVLTVVVEWTATLFGGGGGGGGGGEQAARPVRLLHTLEHVKTLDHRVKLARWVNWGRLFADVPHQPGPAGRPLRFSLRYLPAGLEMTQMQAPPPDCQGGRSTAGATLQAAGRCDDDAAPRPATADAAVDDAQLRFFRDMQVLTDPGTTSCEGGFRSGFGSWSSTLAGHSSARP